MIRFIGMVLLVVLFLICSIPLLLVEWILGYINPDWKNQSSLWIIRFGFRLCLWLSGAKITVIGKENIPSERSVLFVANHRSYFDILLTYVQMERPCGFIAKKEMERFPLLNNWMRNIHCLFLDRKSIKQGLQTILTGIEKLNNGISIFVFPEGTRNKTADIVLPFHKGSFKLAEKSNAPIIPIAINNANALFEDHFPKIQKAHVILEFGSPIHVHELSKEERKELPQLCREKIQFMYEKNLTLVQS